MNKRRVAFATLGCKVNQFDTSDMASQYRQAGWEIVKFNQEADLYIINSCTVTGRSDAESRRMARRARRTNNNARIVVTGCYAQVSPDAILEMPEVDQVLGNEEKHDIVKLVDAETTMVTNLSAVTGSGAIRLTTQTEHTRAFLKIQTGCNQRCSYCIVPDARGPNRSADPMEILDTVNRLEVSGYKEIVLTGIHLGAYSSRKNNIHSLADLLQLLISETSIKRIRLGSIEPNEFTDELINLLTTHDRICHHFHIPMQSGSDSVLKRMGRGYDSGFYSSLVEKMNKALPDSFIAADIISGFPGETEAEFQETCSLVYDLPLADLHIFPYSRRPGTAADIMPGHLRNEIITERASILRNMAEDKGRQFRSGFNGATLYLLGMKHGSDGFLRGLSRNYLEVRYKGPAELLNEEVKILVTDTSGKVLDGEIQRFVVPLQELKTSA